MKSVIVSSVCISAVLAVLMIQSGINGQTSCRQELEEALALSISQTVKEVMEQKSFGIENRNEFIAAFLQALILRMNSETDMTVSVISADIQKGLLDIEVRECVPAGIRLSGNWQGTEEVREIIVRRTVIFDKKAGKSQK